MTKNMKRIIINKNTKRMKRRGGAPPLPTIEIIASEHLQQNQFKKEIGLKGRSLFVVKNMKRNTKKNMNRVHLHL
jgi:hypothetical protein